MKHLIIISILALFSFLLINCETDTTNPLNMVHDTLHDTVEIANIDTVLIMVYDSMYDINYSDTIAYDIVTEIDYKNYLINYYTVGGTETNQSYTLGGSYGISDDYLIINYTYSFVFWNQTDSLFQIEHYERKNGEIKKFIYYDINGLDTTNVVVYDSVRNIIREKALTLGTNSNSFDSIQTNSIYTFTLDDQNRIAKQIIFDSIANSIDTINFTYSNELPTGYNFDESYIKREPIITTYRKHPKCSFQVLKYHSNNMLAEDHQVNDQDILRRSMYYNEEGIIYRVSYYNGEGKHEYTQIHTFNEIPFIKQD